LIKGHYRTIYTFDEKSVSILTAHHSSRDLKKRRFLPVE